MGATDSVEVELLQEGDVPQHSRFSNGLPPPLVMLMPANALEKNRAVVVQELVPLDLVALESHLQRLLIQCLEASVCLLNLNTSLRKLLITVEI